MVNKLTVLTSIHVLGAALWVGGGFSLNLATLLAARSGDPANMLPTFRFASFMGKWFFPPVGLTVIGSGIWLTSEYYTWDLWVVLGMIGAVGVLAIGMLYIGPRAGAALAAMESGTPPPAGRNWVPIASRFSLLVVVAVLVIMVIKPT